MATVNTSYTDGMERLRAALLDGAADIANYKAFVKALSGDIKIVCSPATISKAATAAAWSQEVVVSLQTNSGELHRWYNGNITIAVADTSTAGTAAISPAAGTYAMTDGQLNVTLSGAAAAWLATETATLTVSPSTNNPGLVQGSLIANTTCVVTFTA